jgi:hypothetical protein
MWGWNHIAESATDMAADRSVSNLLACTNLVMWMVLRLSACRGLLGGLPHGQKRFPHRPLRNRDLGVIPPHPCGVHCPSGDNPPSGDGKGYAVSSGEPLEADFCAISVRKWLLLLVRARSLECHSGEVKSRRKRESP